MLGNRGKRNKMRNGLSVDLLMGSEAEKIVGNG
jgi:hypothetical protein